METISQLCSECKACVQTCSKKAITMVPNHEGFSYPVIDSDMCINCGLCQKVCPMINHSKIKNPLGDFFAVQIREKSVLKRSSSGGVFSLLANFVLERGGIVVGAAYQDHLQVRHIIVDKQDDLVKLRGSKYVHSDIGQTYVEVEKNLCNNRWVYFTGTPCQVAGLRLFLRKDYPTLLTSDLVCHGTPSQKVFDAFVGQIEKERNLKILDWNFRDKSIAGWDTFSSFTAKKRKKILRVSYDKNQRMYFQGFISGLFTREDCYSCPYACLERSGDITIADFWGVEYLYPNFTKVNDGVSMIIVNSNKGSYVWNLIKDKTYYLISDLEDVKKTPNHQLFHPSLRPNERETSIPDVLKDTPSFIGKNLSPNDKYKFLKQVVRKKLWRNKLIRNLILFKWKYQ